MELTLALWQSESPVTFTGARYQTREARCHPQPAQRPHPPIWFGEAHPDTLAACEQVGRSVEEIERSLEIQILIVESRDNIREKLQAMADLEPSQKPEPDLTAYLSGSTDELPESITSTWLVGTPDEVSPQLSARIELGIGHFLLWFIDAPETNGLDLFAEAVMPRFAGRKHP